MVMVAPDSDSHPNDSSGTSKSNEMRSSTESFAPPLDQKAQSQQSQQYEQPQLEPPAEAQQEPRPMQSQSQPQSQPQSQSQSPPQSQVPRTTYAALQPSSQPPQSTTPNAPSITSSNPTYPYPSDLIWPAIHLVSTDDSFFPKQIALVPGKKLLIGRQTNNKTAPSPTNGYFDSKVLSRMHAEIWLDQDQVWIKDIKSSNGTFLNGERLSSDGQESDAFSLHSHDTIEFGIDIAGEDNHTILHHKVACIVTLILNQQDALLARSDFSSIYHGGRPPPALVAAQAGQPDTSAGSVGGAGGVGIGIGPSAEGPPLYMRRGTGGGTTIEVGRPGGSHATMNFDRLLARLQAEVSLSRETSTIMDRTKAGLDSVHHSVSLAHSVTTHEASNQNNSAPPAVGKRSLSSDTPDAPGIPGTDKGTKDDAGFAQHDAHTTDLASLRATLATVQAAFEAQSERMALLDGAVDRNEHLSSELAELRHLATTRPTTLDQPEDDKDTQTSATLTELTESYEPRGVNGHVEGADQRDVDGDSGLEERLAVLEARLHSAKSPFDPSLANGRLEPSHTYEDRAEDKLQELSIRLAHLEATWSKEAQARLTWEQEQDAKWEAWVQSRLVPPTVPPTNTNKSRPDSTADAPHPSEPYDIAAPSTQTQATAKNQVGPETGKRTTNTPWSIPTWVVGTAGISVLAYWMVREGQR